MFTQPAGCTRKPEAERRALALPVSRKRKNHDG
jgi:hypothetical protein